MPSSFTTFQYKAHQRGAFSILTAFTLVTLLLFLALVLDSGRLYMEQQRLQKVADMAALEAVSRLANGNCAESTASARAYANESGERHGFPEHEGDQPLLTQCASVQPGDAEGDGTRTIFVDPNGPAVKVTASKTVRGSLITQVLGRASNVDMRAEATAARGAPTAAFSVGSELLRFNNNLLVGQVLKTVGLDTNLNALNAKGLLTAQVTPSGLLQALGVELSIHELKALSPEDLIKVVDTQLKVRGLESLGLSDLITLSAQAVGAESALGIELATFGQDVLTKPLLNNVSLDLFSTGTAPGLLKLEAGPDETLGSALDAQVNLGELLGAGILVGVHEEGRGLKVNELNVLGLADVELGIVEPPSIGIGPVGTKAYNAQIRLYVGADTNELLGGVLSPLTDNLLGTRVNLPISIDVVTGEGTLKTIHCEAGNATADITVKTDVLNICIGQPDGNNKWSKSGRCALTSQADTLIKLLHIPVLTTIPLPIPALPHNAELKAMTVGETRSTNPNTLALGQSVDSLVNALLELLGGLFQPVTDSQLTTLAKDYMDFGLVTNRSDVEKLIDWALNGKKDSKGNEVLAPLFDSDWSIPNGLPVEHSCSSTYLGNCEVTKWTDGTFSSVLTAFVNPGTGKNLGKIPEGYEFCGSAGTKTCMKNNFVKLLEDNANQLNTGDWLTEDRQLRCVGLCRILKPILQPILNLINPVLDGIGRLLTFILADVLGLELGRTDVTVHSISCGTPQLVR